MRKNIFIQLSLFAFFLSALVLVGSSCRENVQEENSEPSSLEEKQYSDYSIYKNAQWGFKLNYPGNWAKKELDGDAAGFSIGFLSPRQDESDMFAENIVVLAYDPKGQDFETVMQAGISEVSKIPGIELSEYKKTFFAGYPAYELRYGASDYNSKFQYIHYFVNGGAIWYQVLYTSEENSYSLFLSEAENIFNSFEIN